MSNEKTWKSSPKVRKESKSLYLTTDDWQYLTDVGGELAPSNGVRKLAPSKGVRKLIVEHRLHIESMSDKTPDDSLK